MNVLKATTIATALFISASLLIASVTAYIPYVFAQTQQDPRAAQDPRVTQDPRAAQDPQTQTRQEPKQKDPTCPPGFSLSGNVCQAEAPRCPTGSITVSEEAQCQTQTTRCDLPDERFIIDAQTGQSYCLIPRPPIGGCPATHPTDIEGAFCARPAPACLPDETTSGAVCLGPPTNRCEQGTFNAGQCEVQATCQPGYTPDFSNPNNPKCKKA